MGIRIKEESPERLIAVGTSTFWIVLGLLIAVTGVYTLTTSSWLYELDCQRTGEQTSCDFRRVGYIATEHHFDPRSLDSIELLEHETLGDLTLRLTKGTSHVNLFLRYSSEHEPGQMLRDYAWLEEDLKHFIETPDRTTFRVRGADSLYGPFMFFLFAFGSFGSLLLIIFFVRHRIEVRPEAREILLSRRYGMITRCRTLNFSEVQDVIIDTRMEPRLGTIHALALVTAEGERLRLEYGWKSESKRRPIRDRIHAAIFSQDTTDGSPSSTASPLFAPELPTDRLVPPSVPIDLRRKEAVALTHRAFGLLRNIKKTDSLATRDSALATLLPRHNDDLKSLDCSYLGTCKEQIFPMSFSKAVFVDPTGTIIIFVIPGNRYEIYSYFDNGSTLITWSSQNTEVTIAQTADYVHQAGTGSLAIDIIGHGERRNERISQGLVPVQVTSLDDTLALSQLYLDYLLPKHHVVANLAVVLIIAGLIVYAVYRVISLAVGV